MRLTPAQPEELIAVADLVNSAYRGESRARAGPPRPTTSAASARTRRRLRADLAQPPAARLLAMRDEPGGALLGCVWLEPAEEGGLVSRDAHGCGRTCRIASWAAPCWPRPRATARRLSARAASG